MSSLSARAEMAVAWMMGRRDHLRRYGLVIALVVFGGGLAWAISRIPDLASRVEYLPLLVLLVIGAPVGMALNSVELYAVSRIGKGPMRWRTAFEVTVYTSAANILPLPGGAIAKMVALKAHGVDYGRGAGMIILTYAIWGGLAFLYSAGAMLWLGHREVAAAFAAVGLLLLAGCGVVFVRPSNLRFVALVALMRIISFPMEAIRYSLAMMAVGASIGFAQSSIFVVASFLGSTAMIIPLGLGFTETVTAVLSPLVAVNAAVGFVAAAVGRVVWMTGLLLTAGVVLLANRKNARRDDVTADQSGSA